MTISLHGKTAIVTGGASGIGHGIVQCFVDAGAEVFVCGRREQPDALPKHCTYSSVDVANPNTVKRFAESVVHALASNSNRTIDILVNNAGVQVEKTVVDSTDEDWEQVIGANARGVFNMCRELIPVMTDGGSIINIGSISGQVADPSMALYNASKAFVHGLTRSIAVDHGPKIRCNAICPGWIETGMLEAGFATADNPTAARQDALDRHPVRRFGKPEDIASLALWLASADSSFATGQLFTIDGGMTASSPLNPGLF